MTPTMPRLGALALVCSLAAGLSMPPTPAGAQPEGAPPELVVLARSDVAADALAAGPVAGVLGAPVLVNPRGFLLEGTADALADLDPQLVVLAGGEAALSSDVQHAVEDLGYTTQRAAGADRHATAVALAGLLTEHSTGRPVLTGAPVADHTIPGLDAELLQGHTPAELVDELSDIAAGWRLGGNAGTDPETDWLGTSDGTAFELRVAGQRALRAEPTDDPADDDPAPHVLGGHPANAAAADVVGATIAGGGARLGFPGHEVSASHGTVGGGMSNVAGGFAATVVGGLLNHAAGASATVAGGERNEASGEAAFVAGGAGNEASGDYSFAAGRNAHARQDGSFVWSDATGETLPGSLNMFMVRASGGTLVYSSPDHSTGVGLNSGEGSWFSISDRDTKAGFRSVDAREVLAGVVDLPVRTWRYEASESGARHMGPTAQDFHAAFGLGADDTTITTVDLGGVAFAAIQGLHAELADRDDVIAELEADREALRAEVADLAERLDRLEGADR